MMKQPNNTQSADILDILLRLRADVITPQQAMERLVPHLLGCETDEQIKALAPIKESIVAQMKYRLCNDSHPFD